MTTRCLFFGHAWKLSEAYRISAWPSPVYPIIESHYTAAHECGRCGKRNWKRFKVVLYA